MESDVSEEGEPWTYEKASCHLSEIPWVRSVNAWEKVLQVEKLTCDAGEDELPWRAESHPSTTTAL